MCNVQCTCTSSIWKTHSTVSIALVTQERDQDQLVSQFDSRCKHRVVSNHGCNTRWYTMVHYFSTIPWVRIQDGGSRITFTCGLAFIM